MCLKPQVRLSECMQEHTYFVHTDSEWPFAAESTALSAFKAINRE